MGSRSTPRPGRLRALFAAVFAVQFSIVIRWAGLGIAIYETVVERIDRPSLLFLAGGMMGLHEILKAQNGKKNGD
jgi:hypothetical protein